MASRLSKIRLFILYFTFAAVFAWQSVAAYAPTYGPDNVTATAASSAEIDLSWTAVVASPAVSGYKIERESPLGGGFAIIVANTGSTGVSYADKNLSPVTQYSYRISAINSDGTGFASAHPAYATTAGAATPPTLAGVPQGLKATAVSGTSISLSWNPAADGTNAPLKSYKIERQGGFGFTVIVNDTGSTGTSYTDNNLSPGATYDYRVSSINSVGTSAPSVSASTMTYTFPDAPQAAHAVAGNSQATISWLPSLYTGGGVIGYLITATPAPLLANGSISVSGSSTLSATFTGLTNNTLYSFAVSSVTPAGTGPGTVTEYVTPRAPLPISTSTPIVVVTTPAPVAAPAATAAATSSIAATSPPVYIFTKTLEIGARGDAVIELQKRLTQEGFLKGSATGYFGVLTRAAVRAYQKVHGIRITGAVGPLTRVSLNVAH